MVHHKSEKARSVLGMNEGNQVKAQQILGVNEPNIPLNRQRRSAISPVTIGVLVLILAIVIQVVQVPSVTGPPSAKKPYTSFQQFYPLYRQEHSNSVSRQLHFAGTAFVILLFLFNLRSVPAMLFAASIGYLLCPALIGLDHGFVELGIVTLLFVLTHKLSTGKIGVAVLIPIIGYGFAWAGHFLFEHNKPATFIYPTYSLMGDFFMFYRICIGEEKF